MKRKALPIIIATIILIVMLAIPFICVDKGQSVTIKATSGSHAEKFADENNLEFISIPDSENSDVEIPSDDKKTGAEEESTEAPAETNKVKDNGIFTYNYNGKTVVITGYKGTAEYVEIPEELDGLPVTAIDMNAVEEGIKEIQIPDSVVKIEGTFKTSRYDASFFTFIIIIDIAYIFAVVSTAVAFKKPEGDQGTWLGVTSVASGIVALIILGILCNISIFTNIPPIIGVIVSIVVFAILIARMIMRNNAKAGILETETNIRNKTIFTKMMTASAQNIVSAARTDSEKAAAHKVYEAFRYSDPMSSNALAAEEAAIKAKMDEFARAIATGSESVTYLADEIVVLVNGRNNKCKALK